MIIDDDYVQQDEVDSLCDLSSVSSDDDDSENGYYSNDEICEELHRSLNVQDLTDFTSEKTHDKENSLHLESVFPQLPLSHEVTDLTSDKTHHKENSPELVSLSPDLPPTNEVSCLSQPELPLTILADIPISPYFRTRDSQPIIVPEVGMKFEDKDEAYAFYKLYSYRIGFGSRKRSSYRFLGDLTTVTYSCSRGKKPKPSDKPKVRNTGLHYTGCKARIILKDYLLNNIWKVTYFDAEHNHEVDPRNSKLFKCNRILPQWVKRQLQQNDKAGIPQAINMKSIVANSGGYDNCTFIDRDMYNHIQSCRALELVNGDASAMMQYFIDRKSTCPNFFYSVQFDLEGRLSRVFWCDERTRAAYRYFGDVLTFDTTYSNNKYDMPYSPFVGVNHHGQTAILGCGLIPDETTETYIWLLQTFLQCMYGVAPKAIITDQCQAICNAINQVFPNTKHRLCLWHIMKKLPQKVGKAKARQHLIPLVKDIVYNSTSELGFLNAWFQMLEKIPEDHKSRDWFTFLGSIREKWVPIFLEETFWAGMSTTQRSESINSFFKGFLKPRTPLCVFVKAFETALRSRWEKEKLADFNDFKLFPNLVSNHYFEHQLASTYTNGMFYVFQNEVKELINVHSTLICTNSVYSKFEVVDRSSIKVIEIDGFRLPNLRRPKVELTLYHDTYSYVCPCNLFVTRGIVCRHALTVYRHMGIQEIPNEYILKRWSKDKSRTIELEDLIEPYEPELLADFNKIYTHSNSILFRLVQTVSRNQQLTSNLYNGLQTLLDTIQKEAYPADSPIQIPVSAVIPPKKRICLDPKIVKSVGRPSEKRMRPKFDPIGTKKRKRKTKKSSPLTPIYENSSTEPDVEIKSDNTVNPTTEDTFSFPDLNSDSHTSLLFSQMNQA